MTPEKAQALQEAYAEKRRQRCEEIGFPFPNKKAA